MLFKFCNTQVPQVLSAVVSGNHAPSKLRRALLGRKKASRETRKEFAVSRDPCGIESADVLQSPHVRRVTGTETLSALLTAEPD